MNPPMLNHPLWQYLQGNLTTVLNHTRSDFSEKYIAPIYASRREAEEKFRRFLNQQDQICYVLTGQAGKGKTTLLCHLAESLTDYLPAQVYLPVLLHSASIDLKKEETLGKDTILRAVAHAIFPKDFPAPEALGGFDKKLKSTLAEMVAASATQQARVIVFIDAINEFKGHKAFHTFNVQFNELLAWVKRQQLPLAFCLSCRSEFWRSEFHNADWARQIFDPSGLGQPTCELGDFEGYQLEQVIQRYFEWYGLDGELRANARQKCQDPIMLRYLCEAYTARKDKSAPPEKIEHRKIGEISELRRKEVFDRFARQKRTDLVRATKIATDLDLSDEKRLYELSTRYLLHIAYTMFSQRRAYITAEEAYQAACALKHPDADLNHKSFLKDPGSVFFRLVDEKILCDKTGTGNFEFVFEAFFEYSLGRYLAFEYWPARCSQGIDPEIIRNNFHDLLSEHNRLIKESNFTNLLGALQYAILETEDISHNRGHENNFYQQAPLLFLDLIEETIRFGLKQGGLDWVQQACAIIRETRLAQTTIRNSDANHDLAQTQIAHLFRILDTLTTSTDFVVMWDLEKTLRVLAVSNFDFTLAQMERWSKGGKYLQAIFATQVLSRLGTFHPEKVIDILLDLARHSTYQNDFWLARPLIYATLELAHIHRQKGMELNPGTWPAVIRMVRTFAGDSPSPFIRGVALAALPLLDNSPETLEWISQRVATETWPWALWNLAFELKNWPWAEDAWLWQILEQLGQNPHPHLRYAVDLTIHQWMSRNSEKAAKIQAQMAGNRWRAALTPGRCDFSKMDRTGIIYSPAYLEPSYNNHIECRERIQAIIEQLDAVGQPYINWYDPRPASGENLLWVHTAKADRHRDRTAWPGYIDDIQRATQRLQQPIHPSPDEKERPSELRYESYDVALLSAGGVISAIDYVLNGPASTAFTINRPPGHLANNAICIFNNIAIGARYAQRQYGLRRVVIIDCDAHQGKHTNQVFIADPEVIYFSMHIEGDYALEDGTVRHIGEDQGRGYNFNLPYPKNMGDDGYIYMVDQLLAPLLREFKPELILISAGFDGHFDDKLTPGCILSEQAYIHLAKCIQQIATELNVKVVGALEGGYGLEGLAKSFVHMVNILGNWGLAPEQIGFTPPSREYLPTSAEEVILGVKKLVKTRVELMKQVKDQRPDYIFDLEHPHWQSILNEEIGSCQ